MLSQVFCKIMISLIGMKNCFYFENHHVAPPNMLIFIYKIVHRKEIVHSRC